MKHALWLILLSSLALAENGYVPPVPSPLPTGCTEQRFNDESLMIYTALQLAAQGYKLSACPAMGGGWSSNYQYAGACKCGAVNGGIIDGANALLIGMVTQLVCLDLALISLVRISGYWEHVQIGVILRKTLAPGSGDNTSTNMSDILITYDPWWRGVSFLPEEPDFSSWIWQNYQPKFAGSTTSTLPANPYALTQLNFSYTFDGNTSTSVSTQVAAAAADDKTRVTQQAVTQCGFVFNQTQKSCAGYQYTNSGAGTCGYSMCNSKVVAQNYLPAPYKPTPTPPPNTYFIQTDILKGGPNGTLTVTVNGKAATLSSKQIPFSGGSTVTVDGVYVNQGDNVAVTIAPDTNWKVFFWTCTGTLPNGNDGNECDFNSVSANGTAEVNLSYSRPQTGN